MGGDDNRLDTFKREFRTLPPTKKKKVTIKLCIFLPWALVVPTGYFRKLRWKAWAVIRYLGVRSNFNMYNVSIKYNHITQQSNTNTVITIKSHQYKIFHELMLIYEETLKQK